MKGYKGFEKGLVCKGKQYAENTVFEEDSAVICVSGMHFCENPLDVLDYYPLINEDGEENEFCEVEALDDPVTDDSMKFATKKLKIGAKLSLPAFINAAVEFVYEKTSEGAPPAGDWSQLAAAGDWSQLAASGNGSKLAASGDVSKLAASGNGSQLAASGNGSKLATAGDWSKLATAGDWSKLAASGYGSKLAAAGNGSKLATAGKKSVVCGIGVNNIAKAAAGSWITLAEYDSDGIVKLVKTEQVDGERIKADTWYKLIDGEFQEV